MNRLDFSKLDPAMLNKPLSELEIKPGESAGNDGIPVVIPDEIANGKQEEAQGASKSSDDDSKVPYSRFKKFHDRAMEAEEEANYWRSKAQERKEETSYSAPIPDIHVSPDYDSADFNRYRTLFAGQDTPEIRQAYKLELERVAGIEERATQRAMDAMERRNSQEQATYRENLSVLDQNLEEASEILGRSLSSEEEVALLDIQDDYSPKDRDGNITALIPVEKAVEIWQMQQARSPRRQARNSVAALSGGSSSEGDGTSSPEQNKDYNPRGGWRQVFGKNR